MTNNPREYMDDPLYGAPPATPPPTVSGDREAICPTCGKADNEFCSNIFHATDRQKIENEIANYQIEMGLARDDAWADAHGITDRLMPLLAALRPAPRAGVMFPEVLLPDILAVLERLLPHLDAIVCYASTMDEHEPNRIAKDVYDLFYKLGGGKDGSAPAPTTEPLMSEDLLKLAKP